MCICMGLYPGRLWRFSGTLHAEACAYGVAKLLIYFHSSHMGQAANATFSAWAGKMGTARKNRHGLAENLQCLQIYLGCV